MTSDPACNAVIHACGSLGRAGASGDVFSRTTLSSGVELRRGAGPLFHRTMDMGIGVRVTTPGLGYASTTDVSNAGAEDCVRMARDLARGGPTLGITPLRTPFPACAEITPDTSDVTDHRATVLAVAEAVQSGVALAGPSVNCERVTVSSVEVVTHFSDVEAGHTHYRRRFVSALVTVRAAAHGEVGSATHGDIACDWVSLDAESIGRQAALFAVAKTPASGPLADPVEGVLFRPWVGMNVLRLLTPLLRGENAARIDAPCGQIGSIVAAKSVTLLDDPWPLGRPTWGPFDDEGIPASVTPLISNGVLTNYLLCRRSAARLGMVPRGHGRRPSFAALPQAHPSSLCLAAGTGTPKDLRMAANPTLELDAVLDAGAIDQRGRFTFTAAGTYWSVQGPRRVAPVTVAGNMLDFLGSIWTVGGDFVLGGAGLGTPSVLATDVLVSV